MDAYKYVKEPSETEANLKRLEALVLEIPKQRAKAQAKILMFNATGTEELRASATLERDTFLKLEKEYRSLRGKVERSRKKQSEQDDVFWGTGRSS